MKSNLIKKVLAALITTILGGNIIVLARTASNTIIWQPQSIPNHQIYQLKPNIFKYQTNILPRSFLLNIQGKIKNYPIPGINPAMPALDNSKVTFPGPAGLQLTGRLYKPAGNGPFKTVIALHGCSGLLSNNGDIGSQFNDWGNLLTQQQVVVLFIDSFSARGLTSVCGTNLLDEDVERVQDAYFGKKYLQSLSYVNANKIILLGWSNGASTVISALARDNNPVNWQNQGKFLAGFAEYPGCGLNAHYGTDYSQAANLNKGTYVPYAPLSILAAELDTTTPPTPKCDNLVSRALQLGAQNLLYQIYPGAKHGFDGSKSNSPLWTNSDLSAKAATRKLILQKIQNY